MKKLNDLKQNFERVTASKIPTKIKKMLLQGILSELKAIAILAASQNAEASLSSQMKFDQTDTNYTAFSHLSLNSNDLSINSRILPSNVSEVVGKQELETQILQKQRMKILLNEEIENYEDDYFHFQKILLTKKEYNEDLDNQISKKSYQISKKSCQKSATPATNQERKSLSYRFKSFFLM